MDGPVSVDRGSMSRYSHVDATSEGLRSLCGKCWIPPEQVKWNRSKKCGEGAYAIVVKGKLALPGGGHEEVAVKQLKPDKMEELDKKDFILEATVLSKLKHPCIVNMFGVGADGDESFFLVSEFMNGGSLKEILWRQMEVPFRRLYSDADAARWCLQIARGLAYLHDCSPLVIHRDLKPENVLLKGPSPSKQDAKLADFGLHILVAKQAQLKAVQTLKRIATRRPSATALMAEEAEALRGAPPSVISEGTTPTISPTTSGEKWGRQFSGASRQSSRASMVSRVNSVKPMRSSSLAKLSAVRSDAGGIEGSYELTGCTGSFLYMAPEVFRGLNYNEKVDVYSFGMIAFELFAHELTFYGMQCRDQVVELMDYVESVALDGFRPEFPPHMPPEVVAIVRRCWDVKPALRPTMRQVVDDLRAYMRDKGIPESKGLVSSASTTAAGAAAGAGSGKSSGCQCVVS